MIVRGLCLLTQRNGGQHTVYIHSLQLALRHGITTYEAVRSIGRRFAVGRRRRQHLTIDVDAGPSTTFRRTMEA